jgi:hypothetical protein
MALLYQNWRRLSRQRNDGHVRDLTSGSMNSGNAKTPLMHSRPASW